MCQRYRYNRYSRYRYCFYSYTKALPALIIDCLFSLSTMPYYYYYYYRCKTCSATASFWVVLSIILLCCLDDSVVHGLLSSAGGSSSSSSSDSRSLLAAEQYAAQARRAELERLLMLNNNKHGVPSELQEIDFSVKERQPTTLKKSSSSGGFGKTTTNKWSKSKAIAEQQAKALERDGVLRINNALSMKTCQALRLHILQEIKSVYALYEDSLLDNSVSPFVVEDYYGIEPSRSCRSDLLLSMQPCAVSMALQELFDESNGKLRALYETLVTNKGVMYELAGVVTSPGSARQCIHPDLPYQHPAPLYVVFVALQDVTSSMGPTTFLKGSNTLAAKDAYCNGEETLDALISDSHIVEATMKMGDLVVFDARTMHCGNANLGDAQANEDESLDRALFNFSFRNPQVVGSLGYKGSMVGIDRSTLMLG